MNHTTRASTKSFEYSISGANQNDDHALTYALRFSYPCHMQIQKKKKEKNTKGQGITEARNLILKLLEEIN